MDYAAETGRRDDPQAGKSGGKHWMNLFSTMEMETLNSFSAL